MSSVCNDNLKTPSLERYSPSTSPQIPSSVITVPAHRHISLQASSLKRTGILALARPENGVYVISSTAEVREKSGECRVEENAAGREMHIVPGGGRRRCSHLRGREKEATSVPFITSLDGEPSRQRRNEANQLHRNFLSGMFAWKWHLHVLSSSFVHRARLTFRGRHARLIKLHRRKSTRAVEKLDPASSSPSSFVDESFLHRAR